MGIHELTLMAAALLCALTAGLVFTFGVVVMPGIRALPDGDFLRAFRVMDRVIQNNDPLFMLVWVGSVLTVIGAAATTFLGEAEAARLPVVVAAALYILCVQLPTVVVNVPLNNRLQALDLATLDEEGLRSERTTFEARWNRWNKIRTFFACVTTALLLLALNAS